MQLEVKELQEIKGGWKSSATIMFVASLGAFLIGFFDGLFLTPKICNK
mgnify:CR=1 FL=1